MHILRIHVPSVCSLCKAQPGLKILQLKAHFRERRSSFNIFISYEQPVFPSSFNSAFYHSVSAFLLPPMWQSDTRRNLLIRMVIPPFNILPASTDRTIFRRSNIHRAVVNSSFATSLSAYCLHFSPLQNKIPYEFSSISLHFSSNLFRRSLASTRFFSVRFNRSARKHLFTAVFASLHPPKHRYRNPREWHSSSAVMISEQPMLSLVWSMGCIVACSLAPEGERPVSGWR